MARHRIPAEKSDKFSSWDIPEVQEGQIFRSEKMGKRGPRGELINVDKQEIIYSNITAEQLEKIANQAYEDVREQAQKDGYQQGYNEGYQAGISAGEADVKQQAQSLSSIVHQVYDHLANQDDEVEQSLINLVTIVSESIIRRDLSINSSHIQQIVNEAISSLPLNSSNITIFLSNNDKQLLESQESIPPDWQLRGDENIQSGGCRITTQHSVVDFTLEQQFKQTIDALVGTRYTELAESVMERMDAEEGKKNTTTDSDSFGDQ